MHDLHCVRLPLTQTMLLLVLLWCAAPTLADEVHLQNGDRLTGKIERWKTVLTLHTDHSGEVKIGGENRTSKADSPLKIFWCRQIRRSVA